MTIITQNSPQVKPPTQPAGRLFMLDLADGRALLQKLLKRSPAHQAGDTYDYQIDRARLDELLRLGPAGDGIDGDHTAAARLVLCGEPGAGWMGVCTHDPAHEPVYHPFSCMLRICPDCARSRSRELAGQITQPIADRAASAPSWYGLKHVVLTTDIDLFGEGVEELREQLGQLQRAAWDMFRSHWPKDGHLGALIGAEFGEVGRKLHFHVLILSRFIEPAWLSAAWSTANGGRGFITHVRKVDDPEAAVYELCKYATKPMKFDGEARGIEETLARIHFVLKGRRRIQPYGSFFKLDRIEDQTDGACPECGGPLAWERELDYLLRTQPEEAAPGQSALDLRTANKLFSKPPPERGIKRLEAGPDHFRQLPLWLETARSAIEL